MLIKEDGAEPHLSQNIDGLSTVNLVSISSSVIKSLSAKFPLKTSTAIEKARSG